MKKVISIILNILSIISAIVTLVLAAFCVYDWITYANTLYAYTIEFWLIIDYYAVGMLIFSLIGLATTVPNIFIAMSENSNKTAKVLIFTFAIVAIISVILYFLPFNF